MDTNILIAQVIKQYENNRVIGGRREIYQGTPEAVAEMIKANAEPEEGGR
jgi:hypothetical protein